MADAMLGGGAVGTELGRRYALLEPISAGAMGVVYRAHDRQTGATVAVKQLIDLAQVARFEIEARLLARLEHPRIVRVLDDLHEASGHYLVMEFVRGADLAQILRELGTPGLPLDRVLDWAQQICEALDYVHEQRMVHRDVKLQNLILGEQGIVLVDFGVAREMTLTPDSGDEVSGSTVAVGTPRYMAPEVFAGAPVSERADVFSVGVTLWTLLAGEAPTYSNRTPLHELRPDIPREVGDVLRAAMEFMPEKRTPSVAALARGLGQTLDRGLGESLATSVEQPSAPRSLLEAIVRTAAGVLDSAAASIALTDEQTGDLVYQAAWGAGAGEIVGVRLAPGQGIAGAVVSSGDPVLVPHCRSDPRFSAAVAAETGYVPYTMIVVPLRRDHRTVGVLTVLDRRDGSPYDPADVERVQLFAELALVAL